ncbi:hypothetical protein BRD56_05445 [Thermoplasmatales archaeon SW_10_69_26]|nr:MAG: hypothetical protein BRD56_05445 [Thermoplasmatales archaeon SW_10_69_26]
MQEPDENDEINEEPDEWADVKSLPWDEGLRKGREMRESTKTYILKVLDEDGDVEGIMLFEYGMLSPGERDQVQKASVKTNTKRRESQQEVNQEKLVTELLIKGIRQGPEGFTPTRQSVAEFYSTFPEAAEDLANCIDEFSEMEPEVRKKFRPGRAREEG